MHTLYTDPLYSKILSNISCICTNVQEFDIAILGQMWYLNVSILDLLSLKQKFSSTPYYLGTDTVIVKRVDCKSTYHIDVKSFLEHTVKAIQWGYMSTFILTFIKCCLLCTWKQAFS